MRAPRAAPARRSATGGVVRIVANAIARAIECGVRTRRVASRVASRMRVDGADDRARTPARGALSTSAVARFDELDEDDVGDVDFQHDDDEDARGDGARDDDGARDGVVGRYRKMRARFDSFSGALSDAWTRA